MSEQEKPNAEISLAKVFSRILSEYESGNLEKINLQVEVGLRNPRYDKLEAALKEAAQTLEWIQSGVSGMFNDGEDKDRLIFDQAARTLARIEEVLK